MKTYKDLLEGGSKTTWVTTFQNRKGETIVKSFPTEQAASDWTKGPGLQFSPGRIKEMSTSELRKLRKASK
jgi:hypothetical protein